MKVSKKELKECVIEAFARVLNENTAQRLNFSDLDAQLAAILASDPKARSARRAANVDGNLGLPQIKDKKIEVPAGEKKGRGRPKKGEEKVKQPSSEKSIFTAQDDEAMLSQIGAQQARDEEEQNTRDTEDIAQDYGNAEDEEETFDSYTSTRSTEELLQERDKWIEQAATNGTNVDNIRPYRRANSEINRRLKMKCEFAEFECIPMSGYKLNENLIYQNLQKDGIDIEQIRQGAEDRDVPILSTSNVKLYPGEVEPTWKDVGIDTQDAYAAGSEDTNDLNFTMRTGKDTYDDNDPEWKPNRYWQ